MDFKLFMEHLKAVCILIQIILICFILFLCVGEWLKAKRDYELCCLNGLCRGSCAVDRPWRRIK